MTDPDGLRDDEDMPCELWGFCAPDCRQVCLANARAKAVLDSDAERKAKLPCPHEGFVVRIACHADDTTPECKAGRKYTGFTCGRPDCKARLMALVKAKTGFDPVTIKIPAEMQAALKEVPF